MTLKNEGEDAYKPETYGNSIVFHRTIWESGQSSVIIKNSNNEAVIKNKNAREEGKRILESFRINTDNPIAILQQEEAKELLKVESPGALYQFFMKSTLLKQCIDQYTSANTELEKSKDIIKEKKSGLEEIRKKFEVKSREYKEVMKFASWEKDEKKVFS